MIVDVLTHAQDPLMVVRLASLLAFPRPTRPTNIRILHAEWIAQVGGEEEGKSTMEGA